MYCRVQCEKTLVNDMTIQEMLAELLLSGMSQRDIAQKVGTTQPTINRAAKGSDIRYVTGKAIECLHQQMTDVADIESAA